ncbi:MAG: hypothetical protein H0T56_15905 [Pseudaminobacter sp.]|nr:hypothetical protein [Pseudaminobacter sp.]
MTKIVKAENARQGRKGIHVFLILISALLLLAIGWAVVEFYGETIDEDSQQTNVPSG